MGGRRASAWLRVLVGLALVGSGLVLTEAPASAVTTVTIGDAPSVPGGSHVNAQDIATGLGFSDITIAADERIDVVDPADLSTGGIFGPPIYNLTLTAPVCNISHQVTWPELFGNLLILDCDVLNLGARIVSGGADIDPSLVLSTATQVAVSGDASIQQGIDLSSHTEPAVVEVAPGTYGQNLTIDHPLTLHGDEGTPAAGAGPDAPTLVGTAPGGNVLTVTSDDVDIEGLRLVGAVDGGSSASSVAGVHASGVDALTVRQNTFEGFSGTAIATPGSTNVVVEDNAILPTTITSADAATFTEAVAGSFTVTTSGQPPATLGVTGALPSGLSFTSNGDGTATLAGTPDSGTAGSYPLTITAADGIGPDAIQPFTLTVEPAADTTITLLDCRPVGGSATVKPGLTPALQSSVAVSYKSTAHGPCAGEFADSVGPLTKMTGKLTGGLSCTPGLHGYPTNGKFTLTFTELGLNGKPQTAQVYVRTAPHAGVSDQQDVARGIVTKGLASGADVSLSMLQAPVQTKNGPANQSSLAGDGTLVPGPGTAALAADCAVGVAPISTLLWSTGGTSIEGPVLDSGFTVSLPG